VTKIRIKMGPIEVEFEGSEEFLKAELPQLLSALSKLCNESAFGPGFSPSASVTSPGGPPPAQTGQPPRPLGTTGTIAAKLQAKSGPGLILAAAAKLLIGDAKATATRQELIDEMRNAAGYFKATYVNNMSKYLQGLVKEQKLLESSKDVYSLSAPEKEDLERRLAA